MGSQGTPRNEEERAGRGDLVEPLRHGILLRDFGHGDAADSGNGIPDRQDIELNVGEASIPVSLHICVEGRQISSDGRRLEIAWAFNRVADLNGPLGKIETLDVDREEEGPGRIGRI